MACREPQAGAAADAPDGVVALGPKPRTSKTRATARRSIPICWAESRSSGSIRCGAPTSPTSRRPRLSLSGGRSSTGRAARGARRGGCRTRWTLRSVVGGAGGGALPKFGQSGDFQHRQSIGSTASSRAAYSNTDRPPGRLAPQGARCGLTRTPIDQPCLSLDLSAARERLAVRLCLADACDPRRA